MKKRFLSILIVASMLTSLISLTAFAANVNIGSVSYASYEAEEHADARAYANPSPLTDAINFGASGGKVVGRFWGIGVQNPWPDWGGPGPANYTEAASISFTHNVPVAGDYALILQYQADKNFVLNLLVNGTRQDLPITGGGTKDSAADVAPFVAGTVVKSTPVIVRLTAGDNKIKIESTTTALEGWSESICPDAVFISVAPTSSNTVDKTGFSSLYTQDFVGITNDAAGLAKMKEFWNIEVEGSFGGIAIPDTTPVQYNGMRVENGALHLKWSDGRALNSINKFSQSIVSFDAKLEGHNPGQVFQVVQAFAIRQIDNGGLYQAENDQNTTLGAHPGLEGMIFELTDDAITVVVDDTTVPTDKTGLTSWNIASRILLPGGLSFVNFEKVTVVDKGTDVKLFVGDVLLAKIELANLVDGVYKTATIKDVNGNVLATTTTANVPEKGKIGFGVRSWSMDIDNIEIMTKTQATEVDKVIIPRSFDVNAIPDVKQSIQLSPTGTVGQSFTANEQFNTIGIAAVNWDKTTGNYTFELRKDGPTGQIVYRHVVTNALQGNIVYVVGNLPAGTYYFEMNNRTGTETGMWASKTDTNSYADGTAYLDGTAMNYDFAFSVESLVVNATAVGNEYVAEENPVTADLGAIQIAVMAVASAVIALKRKKESL